MAAYFVPNQYRSTKHQKGLMVTMLNFTCASHFQKTVTLRNLPPFYVLG